MLLLVAAAATPAAPATVRIGGLFPRRSTSGEAFSHTSRRLAAFVLAIKEINDRTDILPHTNLTFAVKDSKCSKGYALIGAHELISESFGGTGISALVGAACSSASVSAASYATMYAVPQLSPSSTSAALSDAAYPYFARVAPSDALQSFALADLVENQLGVSRVACVYSEDAYGTAGMASFISEARLRRIDRLAVTSFANGVTDFTAQIDALRSSAAGVIVLFCQAEEAARFFGAVQAAGNLGNTTWVGSEAATSAVNADVQLQAGLLGYLGLRPHIGRGAVYEGFLSRLDAFQAGVVGAWGCSNATDDDGVRLWRLDDAAGGGCYWPGGRATDDFYAAFAYDAVHVIARALGSLFADGADGVDVDGDALYAAIVASNFSGVTGELGFDDLGDRNRGIRYGVISVDGGGAFELGTWVEGSTWELRYSASPNASYASVHGTGAVVSDLDSSAGVLKLGVLCHTATLKEGGSKTMLEECDHILHAIDALNDKGDGVFDELLPNRTIVSAVRSVGCVEERARDGWMQLHQSSPGGFDFAAVIGPTCSNDVQDLSGAEWRAGDGDGSRRAVVISHSSTAERLGGEAGEAEYVNVARTVSNDASLARGLSALFLDKLGWERVAILHDDTTWATGAAEGFRAVYEAGGGEVLRGADGKATVGFELNAFDNGKTHVSSLVARLRAVEPKVIAVMMPPRVQRAFFAHIFDAKVLYGQGYGYVTLWMSEDVFLNNASSVNMSAVYGSCGVLALHPTSLVGKPSVVAPMVERWRGAARAACDGLGYCDADGDAASWAEFSASAVDAVLLYAHAADALLRSGGDVTDPDALYQMMLSIPPFEGVAGRVVLDSYGDRLGTYMIYNMQIGGLSASRAASASGAGRGRRHLATSIELYDTATFVQVGMYESHTENLNVDLERLVYSGGAHTKPGTETPCDLDPSISSAYYKYTPRPALAQLRHALALAASLVDWMPAPHTVLVYLLVWLGAAMHAIATPLAFVDQKSGYVDDDACVARTCVSMIAPALVALGVTVRIGEMLRERQVLNYRVALCLFLLLLCTMMPGLAAWALDNVTIDGPGANAINYSIFVDMGSDVPISFIQEYSRCRRLEDFSTNAIWALVAPSLFMSFAALLLHLRSMWLLAYGHDQHIIFQEWLLSTLLVLAVNFFTYMVLASSAFMTDSVIYIDFAMRLGIGGAVGWLTLIVEVLLPEYRRNRKRWRDRGLRLLDKNGHPLELERPLYEKKALGQQGFHVFLSHSWAKGQDQMHTLAPMLRLMVPEPKGIKLWLDVEQLKEGVDEDALKVAVERSDAILVFLTEKYVSSGFCRAELTAARKHRVKLIVVQEASKDHGGVTPEALECEINEAMNEDEQLSEDTKQALRELLEQVKAQHEDKNPLYWYRHEPFKRAVLKRVVELLLLERQKQKGRKPSVLRRNSSCAGPSYRQHDKATLRDEAKDEVGPSEERTSHPQTPMLFFNDELHYDVTRTLSAHGHTTTDIYLYLDSDYPPLLYERLKQAFEKAATAISKPGSNQSRVTVRVHFNPKDLKLASFRGADHSRKVTPVLCLHNHFFSSNKLIDVAKEAFDPIIAQPNIAQRRSKTAGVSEAGATLLRKEFGAKQAPSIDAILLYSTEEQLHHYRDKAREAWLQTKKGEGLRTEEGEGLRQNLLRPLWHMWPHDVLLQTVAAEAELRRLLEAKAASQIIPHSVSGRINLSSVHKANGKGKVAPGSHETD